MTQDEILTVIRKQPGVKQVELYSIIGHNGGVVSRQIGQLMKYGLVTRVTAGKTFMLYPVGDFK